MPNSECQGKVEKLLLSMHRPWNCLSAGEILGIPRRAEKRDCVFSPFLVPFVRTQLFQYRILGNFSFSFLELLIITPKTLLTDSQMPLTDSTCSFFLLLTSWLWRCCQNWMFFFPLACSRSGPQATPTFYLFLACTLTNHAYPLQMQGSGQ